MPRSLAPCLALTVGLAAACFASDNQPSREQLQAKLSALQSRVAELEQQQYAAPDPRDVARVVDEMVADAERRSQLLLADEGLTSGFDLEKTKFFIRSSDGSFLLTPGLFIQIRDTTDIITGSDGDTNNGWEIRRLKILFEGNLFSPDLQYKFQWETATNGGTVFLQDAWMRYKFAKDLAFQFGQFKDPWNHEETVGDQLQLAAERSLLNALLGGGQTDRIQGIMLLFDNKEHWRGALLFDDGYRSLNTAFNQGGGSNFTGVIPTDFGFSGRLEYFVDGSRKEYDNLNGAGMKEDLLVFGAGSSFSQAGDSNVVFNTVDAQYENGKNVILYGALIGVYREIGAGEPVPPGNFWDWGFLVQGGYFINEKLEAFARIDYTFLDEDQVQAGASDDLPEITVGFNYFFRKNSVRFVLDFTWLPNGVPVNAPGLGFLASDDDQFVIRAQFQLFI